MNIVRHEPWTLLSRWNRDFDSYVAARPASSVAFIPAVDVREESDRYVVQADLPGVAPADIEVSAEKGVLTISGERKSEKREEKAGYARIERTAGSFKRRFALPDTAQTDAIKARFTQGVLEVSIPKQAQPAATRITVEAA
ncbi:MAG: Hsp20/alpha crystallin family protein [Pseudomonadota bacterium]